MCEYDELLEAIVGGSIEDVEEIFSQLSGNLCSTVAQLVLQLAVYYGYPSLVEVTINYKVCIVCGCCTV